ncbi:MAG TPA: pyruvate formate lyase family protein [Bacteroidota bacterium]|nr:pyruvate formate lyase family protein [Bacteroidota bacterium]
MEVLSYKERIEKLREKKIEMTNKKRKLLGSMDFDDQAIVLPPEESILVLETINSSGVPVKDAVLKEFVPKSNHPSGGFFGPRACGENFRDLLKVHPVYIDPLSELAGAYMVNFISYRSPQWNPDIDYSFLKPEIDKYKLICGIGAPNHFCQDLQIGFDLGWKGLKEKIKKYRKINTSEKAIEFYDGLDAFIEGMQIWIKNHADEALKMAENEENPQFKENLLEMAQINHKIVNDPPETFKEALQWMLWYQMAGKMYNGSGSLGRIDKLLYPYYKKDIDSGKLTEEKAKFLLACYFLRDTSYSQLGGPDEDGNEVTNPLSYLVLEATHWLRIPVNVAVSVGKTVPKDLLLKGVEILFEDKTGIPKFLGIDNTIEGFTKNGFSIELARTRAYSGCHWYGLPGREYCINDCIKINFPVIFDLAFREMLQNNNEEPSIEKLWFLFEKHLSQSIDVMARCLDFQFQHMWEVYPELHLSLLCHGTIEKGLDASNGGVEYYNFGLDGAGLATVADSFAAVEQRVVREKRISWKDLLKQLDNNWSGADGEKIRLMMKNIPRYGSGSSIADEYAIKIAKTFTKLVKEKKTPEGHNMIPGLFSWASHIAMGQDVGATPNGRFARAPISHGSNPDPGFRKDGALTALSNAIASVQSGYGNASPLQLEVDPGISKDEGGLELISNLISTHFELGGSQININVIDKNKILEAHKNPESFPDLVVRVTGFSAFFANLSPEFRQLVVDRIISEG